MIKVFTIVALFASLSYACPPKDCQYDDIKPDVTRPLPVQLQQQER